MANTNNEMCDIEEWLKAHPDISMKVEWGEMTGEWQGHKEILIGFIITFYRGDRFCCSSAPHSTIRESFNVIADHLDSPTGRSIS